MKRVTIQVNIADLCLRLDSSRKLFNSSELMGFSKFINAESEKLGSVEEVGSGTKCLQLSEVASPPNKNPGKPILQTAIWELWENEAGEFTFYTKRFNQSFITVNVDHDFDYGQIFFDEMANRSEKVSPFDLFDIRLYVNWLANSGDFMFHASGLVYQGKGYCFLGESGRGKSTLARYLSTEPGVTILGEDQVIIRYLGDRFYVFGTPWHTEPDICSPMGAPLQKMYILDRTQPVTLREMLPLEVTSRILQIAFVPWYRQDSLPLILERVSLLAESVRCFGLNFRLGQDGLEILTNT